jgi:hypothetical protein
MSFMMLRNAEIDPAIFGIFGGGGRSGSFTFGRDGRSGRSGRGGICGNKNKAGSARSAEKFPIESDGRSGSLIGEIRGSKLGIEIDIPNRISERSRMMSGHFGNLITGIDGMSIDRSLNFQYWRL